MAQSLTIVLVVGSIFILFAIVGMIVKMYKKASQGQALVRTGQGGTKVGFSGLMVVPILHRLEIMDITLKTIMISRMEKDGLICKDNMRADIKVTFFVRVNKTKEDVIHVSQSIGCERASDPQQLELLFDAKFSEALKTVGKHFEFVELYNSRAKFKEKILEEIGTDLNGYILDDCAIDYLEQTSVHVLNAENILDAEGIKKITELTATQAVLANQIAREKEKTIKKQDVEARETILELERQQTEAEERQQKEISTIRSRERAEADKIREEERLKSERARIQTEEEVQVAEENRMRNVLVASKNKEKTDAIETERVEQARSLEATERERVVELARIEKEKALEVERKAIADVVRERIAVEKAVVDEEERIKDTKAFAEADRNKAVAMKKAEEEAEAALVKEIKAAEAQKQAAEHLAKRKMIDAESDQASAGLKADAMKQLAEAEAAQKASLGLAEAQVMEAKAAAREKEGDSEAAVIEAQSIAEAKGIEAKASAQAEADQKLGTVAAKVAKEKGLAEAEVIEKRAASEEKAGLAQARVLMEKAKAEGQAIREKAAAMRELDTTGIHHEEFKLQLAKEKEVELANMEMAKEIAIARAQVLADALKAAKIDIVGGESMFFDQIVGSITRGKAADRLLHNSEVLTEVKNTFLSNGNGQAFREKLRGFIDQFGITSEDVRNLSISALILKMMNETKDEEQRSVLQGLNRLATSLGVGKQPAHQLGLSDGAVNA